MDEAHRTADAAARRSYGKLVAYLAAQTRDVASAEDALSEAFTAALTDWPRHGCPSNPEAWLLSVARRKAIDAVRKRTTGERLVAELRILADTQGDGGDIPDRRLALLFACAHPALDPAIRTPLMLQVVLGLDATSIASAFLTSPAAMSKRLVRAKEKIRAAGIPFTTPERSDLAPRLDAVLDAVYAAFSEGWSDPIGPDSSAQGRSRQDLTAEALYLARLVAELLPDEPEALGLLALMLHAEARRRARRTSEGEYVPLNEQDQSRWDWAAIQEAEGLIHRAASFGVAGRFQLEAALHSAHVYRCRDRVQNWDDIVRIYDALLLVAPSPVIAMNRTIAIAERDGAPAALRLLDNVAADGRLETYAPYWAARAHLLAECGADEKALAAYDKAITIEQDAAVRRFLERHRSRVLSRHA